LGWPKGRASGREQGAQFTTTKTATWDPTHCDLQEGGSVCIPHHMHGGEDGKESHTQGGSLKT
jgi:hypothetical protein